jgi:lipid-A-disaccharide synthase
MKLLVSALEHSANIHLKSLLSYLDNVELLGIFDEALGSPIADVQSQAVMGYADAIGKLRFYLDLAEQMVALADQADTILLIDSSGFNLPLSKKLKKAYPDKEIIYYILPEAWAWKRGRIPKLEERIDRLASIFPFEPSYYSDSAPITYVGHPLLDQIKRFKTHINPEIETVCFMPGSRKSIIQRLMPVFREVADQLDIRSLLVIPPPFTQEEVNHIYGTLSGFEVVSDSRAALLESDFAFICKGTATLEASLIGTPFALVYQFSWLDALIFRWVVDIQYMGLGNILFKAYKNRVLHPELLQRDVNTQTLIETMRAMDREHFYQDSLSLITYLEHGSAEQTAALILDIHSKNLKR